MSNNKPDYIFTLSAYDKDDDKEVKEVEEFEKQLRYSFGNNILIFYIDDDSFTMSQLNNEYTRVV